MAKLGDDAANLFRRLGPSPPRLLVVERSEARLCELPDKPWPLYTDAEKLVNCRKVNILNR